MAVIYKPSLIARPTRELCVMACCFCRDPLFQNWVMQRDDRVELPATSAANASLFKDQSAKLYITMKCGVNSRNELDTNPEAAQRFHDQIRTPFLAWKEAQG